MDAETLKALHFLDLENDSKSSGSTTEPYDCVGDDFRVTRSNRKVNIGHPDPPKNQQRGHSNNAVISEPTEVPVEGLTENGCKRKAGNERETPSKRQRGGNTDTDTGEPTEVPVEDVRETDSAEQSTRREIGCEVSPSSSSPSTSQQNDGRAYPVNTSIANFEAKYLQLAKLGEGGFGSVFAGKRKADRLPVAIKRIPRVDVETQTMVINGRIHEVPVEVLLMLRVAGGPQTVGKSAAVSLIDWYDLDQEVLLVMERPVPSVDLYHYLEYNGPLREDEAKNIMKQLVEAAIQMHSDGVFHRDIKTENVLVETRSEVPRVRLIDFGCGCFAKKRRYRCFSGTPAYAPPEFYINGTYKAGPTTVWQLGALLYEILDGYKQCITSEVLRSEITFDRELSQDCQDLLKVCLDVNPRERATLEQMQQHPWFT